MSQLTWDQVGDRFYETGVDRGVLYWNGSTGISWSGLASVDETFEESSSPNYVNGVKYLDNLTSGDFAATIEAITYPRELEYCDGSVSLISGSSLAFQNRMTFGLSYRTLLGNDLDETDHGYLIHLIYNAVISTSDRDNETWDDSISPQTFSWDLTTTPALVPHFKPTAHLMINSTEVSPSSLNAFEDVIYGNSSNEPRLMSPTEVVGLPWI